MSDHTHAHYRAAPPGGDGGPALSNAEKDTGVRYKPCQARATTTVQAARAVTSRLTEPRIADSPLSPREPTTSVDACARRRAGVLRCWRAREPGLTRHWPFGHRRRRPRCHRAGRLEVDARPRPDLWRTPKPRADRACVALAMSGSGGPGSRKWIARSSRYLFGIHWSLGWEPSTEPGTLDPVGGSNRRRRTRPGLHHRHVRALTATGG